MRAIASSRPALSRAMPHLSHMSRPKFAMERHPHSRVPLMLRSRYSLAALPFGLLEARDPLVCGRASGETVAAK